MGSVLLQVQASHTSEFSHIEFLKRTSKIHQAIALPQNQSYRKLSAFLCLLLLLVLLALRLLGTCAGLRFLSLPFGRLGWLLTIVWESAVLLLIFFGIPDCG